MFNNIIMQVESEIQETIRKAQNSKQMFSHQSGRRLMLNEVMQIGTTDGPIIGAMIIFYAAGQFMTLDRIIRTADKFRKQRRIIYYLNSTAGQIGSTLLLELLKLEHGDHFSKSKFVQYIDEKFFETLSVSSGEINEALSRMLRKTMKSFFGIDGKYFDKKDFIVYFQQMGKTDPENIKFDKHAYETNKRSIDMNVIHILHDIQQAYA